MQLINKLFFLILVARSLNSFSQSMTNLDFEQSAAGSYTAVNSVNGWTLSSQTTTGCPTSTVWAPGSPEFSIVSTPVTNIPTLGFLGASPLGGTLVAQLNNNTANYSKTRLIKDFVPTSTLSVFEFAFAGIIETYSAHSCCEQAGFEITFRNQSGVLLCQSHTITPGCAGTFTFSQFGTKNYTSWQQLFVDLSPYSGTNVTIEVTASDCSCGLHHASLFFDLSQAKSMLWGVCYCPKPPPQILVEMCPGSSIARLTAPYGYSSYQWIGPYGIMPTFSTQSAFTLTSAAVGATYSVLMTNQLGCQYLATVAIAPSFVTVQNKGTTNSCVGGASGSATVIPIGSATAYSYIWTNSGGQSVGSTSVVNNLTPGSYSVTVSSAAGCGTVQTNITVGTRSNLINKVQPYCGNQAFITLSTGTNYQWYYGSQAISAGAGGTLSTLTVNSPTTNTEYSVTFLSGQGCHDSIVYVLVSVPPGTVSVINNKLICPDGINGTAIISMTPAIGTTPGSYSFWVANSNTNTATYNSSVTSGSSTQFTVSNLSALGNYTVNAFDGSCKYSSGFSVSVHTWSFNLTPVSSTLCNTASIGAGIQYPFDPRAGACTYSWSPTNFLIGGNGSLPSTVITPTTLPGNTLAIIYTVMVTPTISGCSITKTLQVVTANLIAPTITPVAPLCKSSPIFTLDAQPGGGMFNANNSFFVSSGGVVNPQVVNAGTYPIIYTNKFAACTATSTTTLSIIDFNLSLSGDQNICQGGSSILTGGGATSYTWNTGITGNSISVSPPITTSYIVSAFDELTGCLNTGNISVNVYSVPVISISGVFENCFGDTVKLKASGADTYTWNSFFAGKDFTDSPNGSGTYYVVGSVYPMLCSSSSSVYVKVYSLPNLHFTGSFIKCFGDESIINVVGASTYTWNGNYEGPTFPIVFKQNVSFTVIGTDSLGCSRSAVVTVSVGACTGIQKNEPEFILSVHPNPSSGIVKLICESENKKAISVYDVTGRVFFSNFNELRETTIDLTLLPPGFYLVKVQSGTTVKVIRIIRE